MKMTPFKRHGGAAVLLLSGLLAAAMMSGACAQEYRGYISSVQQMSGENKAGAKVEGLRINTQTGGGAFEAVVRVAIEVTDRNGKVALGRGLARAPFGEVQAGHAKGAVYTGAVQWIFEMEHGDLKRPDITGYAVELGYEPDGEFVRLAEECYRVESTDELLNRHRLSKTVRVRSSRRPEIQ